MDSVKSNYQLLTYGCKVNTYDSGLLQNRLKKNNFFQSGDSDLLVVNTCAVTSEATRQALRDIRKFKRQNPKGKVVVTGCGAQVDTEVFDQCEQVDLIVANSHKGQLQNHLQRLMHGQSKIRVYKSNIFKKSDLEAGGGIEKNHTRSFLKIQDGCNSFCTFCIIPFARGKSRSIPASELIRRVEQLYREGVKEVVLSGVHIGDYYDESLMGRGDLAALVAYLLKYTSMPRFRLTSLEPIELTEPLLDLFSDSRLCPHFHMSIQSANSKILNQMKRNYGAMEVEWSLNEIARRCSDAFVGMDVIVGFPQETASDFNETYKRLENLPWTRIHVFPYSRRPGTYAHRMDGHCLINEIKDRAKVLRHLSSERYGQMALNQVGCRKKVLLLSKGVKGLSRDYWPVQIENASALYFKPGTELMVDIQGYDHSLSSRMEGCLMGVLVN